MVESSGFHETVATIRQTDYGGFCMSPRKGLILDFEPTPE
jgi:hypothetical protein